VNGPPGRHLRLARAGDPPPLPPAPADGTGPAREVLAAMARGDEQAARALLRDWPGDDLGRLEVVCRQVIFAVRDKLLRPGRTPS
jgi:hypothetical protein